MKSPHTKQTISSRPFVMSVRRALKSKGHTLSAWISGSGNIAKICVLTLIWMFSFTHTAQSQYLKAQGTQIVDGNGNPIFLKGINLGNWLLWEGYLMMGDFEYRTHTQFFNGIKGAFGGDLVQAMEFEHQWRMNYVDEQSIIDLKGLGFNSVRVPFHYNMFWDWNTYAPTNHGFQYIDRLIEFCRTHGMYVLLDMHAAPGYQNPGDHCDNLDSNASQPRDTVYFWDGDNVNVAAQIWKHIANYYHDEPVIWGYDLINEPVPQDGREYELLPSLITMRNAIREVDTNHIIVAEGSWWGSDMHKLDWEDSQVQSKSGVDSRWDSNLVYQTHHYSNDPTLLNGRKVLTDRLNVPLMLGEYGENTHDIIRQMSDWCIDNNVSYFPWSFKKMYHDKCLWTIHPNDAYNAVRDYIKNPLTPPENAYNDMIAFCQNNIGNNVQGLTFHQDFHEAVKFIVSFDIWIAGYDPISTENKGKLDDADGDGITNAAEMFFGNSPRDNSDRGGMAVLRDSDTGLIKLRFNRSKTVPASVASARWSSDLQSWNSSGATSNGIAVSLSEEVVDRSNPDKDVVEIVPSVTSGNTDKLFFRLHINTDDL